MKVIRGKNLKYIPVAHEDLKDPGAFKKVLFKKEELPAGRIQMINWAKLLVGRTMREHTHENMEEIFVILHGSVLFRAGDRQEVVDAGDAILVNAREAHEMTAQGKNEVVYIVIGIVT
ncbi:MAG: cupin domain-containing protein [Patescibacteria group bacterium]